MILIDTHVWIWLNSSPNQLCQAARERLENEPKLALSSISIYETMVVVEKGRFATTYEPDALVRRWLRTGEVVPLAVGDEVAIRSRSLKFFHEDPFDRIIAGTANYEKVPLMTADRNLLRLEWLTTIPAR